MISILKNALCSPKRDLVNRVELIRPRHKSALADAFEI